MPYTPKAARLHTELSEARREYRRAWEALGCALGQRILAQSQLSARLAEVDRCWLRLDDARKAYRALLRRLRAAGE